jgi:hypothetical protein
MKPLTILRTALFVLLIATIAAGADKTYQKGTVTKNPGNHVSYDLTGPGVHKLIGNCADFQTGQTVDYRVEGNKVYIRQENGKEYKCNVEGSYDASPEETPITYQKGTILGYGIRRDTHVGGGGGGGVGTPSNSVSSWTRKAKVYELQGPNLIYQIDYCGAFQAGKFTPGQVVDFRVDQERLYILHDKDKEYSCQLEGTRVIEGAPAAAPAAAPAPATPAPAGATPAAAPPSKP